MINTGKLAGKTIFITGASRGIGKAIALKAAKDGANIVIAAKTAAAHPKLPGTIYTAAEEVEKAGGKALPCIVDVRDENQVAAAVENAVKKFGGIDILINNASAISLTGTLETDMKRYDLMHNINTRGTFLVSKVCLPYLKKGKNPHIVNISPPLNLNPLWFKNHVAYTMAKYGMSMCVLGMADEFKDDGIAVNALWPRTAILTAAIEMLTGKESAAHSRKPEIVADAAYALITKDAKSITGKFLIDDDILRAEGLTEAQIDQYACVPNSKENLLPDFFLDEDLKYTGAPGQKKTISGMREFHTSSRSASSSGDKPAGANSVESIFAAITKRLSPELVKSTQAIFQFNLSGEEEGTWYLDLKNGSGAVGKGNPPNTPDSTLTMTSTNFNSMFSGKLKPTSAFMTGKLKISGNLQKAMKLEKLMTSLKSKM